MVSSNRPQIDTGEPAFCRSLRQPLRGSGASVGRPDPKLLRHQRPILAEPRVVLIVFAMLQMTTAVQSQQVPSAILRGRVRSKPVSLEHCYWLARIYNCGVSWEFMR